MNKIDKLKQLVLGVNETFHNVMMTPRIPHAEKLESLSESISIAETVK